MMNKYNSSLYRKRVNNHKCPALLIIHRRNDALGRRNVGDQVDQTDCLPPGHRPLLPRVPRAVHQPAEGWEGAREASPTRQVSLRVGGTARQEADDKASPEQNGFCISASLV